MCYFDGPEYYDAINAKGEYIENLNAEAEALALAWNQELEEMREAKMLYFLNALSLNMFDINDTIHLKITPISIEDVKQLLNNDKDILVSAIGHEDTAKILSNMLGIEIKVNRINVKITQKDYAIIAQYIGSRLPEGATALPEGAVIKFYFVRLI